MSLVNALVGGVVGVLTGFGKKKAQPPPPQPIAPSTIQQRPNSAAADAIAGRRGSRANQRSSGGEPSNGGLKNTLGS
jgi:hypothetical protein